MKTAQPLEQPQLNGVPQRTIAQIIDSLAAQAPWADPPKRDR
jgi:hypothetical protein